MITLVLLNSEKMSFIDSLGIFTLSLKLLIKLPLYFTLSFFVYACQPKDYNNSNQEASNHQKSDGELMDSNSRTLQKKQSSKTKKPNILFVLTDDQGWGDLGHNNNDKIDTPNLDTLFTKGVSFDRFYVSPVCSPTRAALLTGRHPISTGVHGVTRGGEKMVLDEVTIATQLKKAGYVTGIFGKWHNGLQYPYNPMGKGFDEFYGFADGHITRYFNGTITHNHDKVSYKGYLPDRITDKTIEFITKNKEKPFFAYLAFNTPHSPFEVPKKDFNKYKARGLGNVESAVYGMMENIDNNIQKVLNTLEKHQLTNDTIVIFTSDNGPSFPKGVKRYNGHMKGAKGTIDEGGVRVPMVVYWPNIIDGGRVVPQIAQHIDVFPTLLNLVGVDSGEHPIHGVDISELLINSQFTQAPSHLSNRTLFTHRMRIGEGDNNWIRYSPAAVRTQKWVATSTPPKNIWSLYDIIDDPNQMTDVSKKHPKVMSRLKNAYDQWFNQMVAGYKEIHGEYQPLPIHIGHKESKTVEFPAHEGLINGSSLTYANGYGWSHDWIITSKNTGSSTIEWPIKNVTQGAFEVLLGYASPTEPYVGTLRANIDGNELALKELKVYTPTIDKGLRLAHADGEADDLTWNEVSLGKTQLNTFEGKLSLTIENDGKNNLMIKYIKIKQL